MDFLKSLKQVATDTGRIAVWGSSTLVAKAVKKAPDIVEKIHEFANKTEERGTHDYNTYLKKKAEEPVAQPAPQPAPQPAAEPAPQKVEEPVQQAEAKAEEKPAEPAAAKEAKPAEQVEEPKAEQK